MSNELLFEIGTEEIPAAIFVQSHGGYGRNHPQILNGKTHCLYRNQVSGHTAPSGSLLLPIWRQNRKIRRSKNWGRPKRPLLMKTASRPKPRWVLPEDRDWKSPNWKPSSLKKANIWAPAKLLPASRRQRLLPEILTSFLLAIPFRKSMRWAKL